VGAGDQVAVAEVDPLEQPGSLAAAFPDGVIRLPREGRASCPTSRTSTAAGVPGSAPTTRLPLLDQASAIGGACRTSTLQWAAARRSRLGLIDIIADA